MVQNQAVMVWITLQGMDKRFSAHRWLLRHLELFAMQNLVSPMHSQLVETPQGVTMVQGIEEMVKSKRQLVMSCIEVYFMPWPEKALTYQWCFIV